MPVPASPINEYFITTHSLVPSDTSKQSNRMQLNRAVDNNNNNNNNNYNKI